MPRRFAERLAVTKPYTASTPTPIDLPRDRVITSLLLDVDFNLTTGATPGTTQDAYYRIFTSLSILGEANNSFVGWGGDVRAPHFENKVFLPGGGRYIPATVPGASATSVTRKAQLRIHFGVRPVSPDGTYNPYDLTAGIPAGQSSLVLTPTWAPATNLGSGWTINAATLLGVTVYGIQAKAGEVVKPAMIPAFQSAVFTPPNNTSGPSGVPYAVPTGHFWHSSMILSLAGTAPADNRSRSALTDVGLKLPIAGNAQVAKWDWSSFEDDFGRATEVADDDGTTFGTPTIAAGPDMGVGRIDLTTIGGAVNPLYGLDMRGADQNNVMITMGVATVGTVMFFHRFYDQA